MKKVFVYFSSYACGQRALDAEKISKYFSINNYKVVDKAKDADIIIFITCGVNNSIAEDSLNKVKEFQKYDAELIVAGCIYGTDKDKLDKIFNGRTIVTKEINNIDKLFPENKIKFSSIDDTNIKFQNLDIDRPIGVIQKIFDNIGWVKNIYARIIDHILKNIFGEYSFIYMIFLKYIKTLDKKLFFIIRISWGCLGNCSYCAIKKGVGHNRSKPFEECIREFRKGLDEGFKKFMITSDDPGAYGLDIGSSFPELIDEMTKIQGDYELSIRNINPRWAVKYVDNLEKILERGKVMHLEIPIQSGSDRILKLMNRFSDFEKIKDAALRLKKASQKTLLFTHIIIGFPTESEEEFKETLNAIIDLKINSGGFFPFSSRSGTIADTIEKKVPQEEISRRLKYAKIFLKKAGYKVVYISSMSLFMFEKLDL